MKTLFCICIAASSSTFCFGQFTKGTMKVGGELEIIANSAQSENGSVERDYKEVGFDLGPHFGYFIKDNFCVGGGIFVGYNSTTDYEYVFDPFGEDEEIEIEDRSVGFGIAPGAEYFYGFGEKKKFGLAARASVGWKLWSGTMENYDSFLNEVVAEDYLTNSIGILVIPGLFYRPTDCLMFGLNFGGFRLGYDFSITNNTTTDVRSTSHDFVFGGNLDKLWWLDKTKIGVSYIFGGKNNTVSDAQ